MKPNIALSLFKYVLEARITVEQEDNNITYQYEANTCESSIVLQCVAKSSIAQTLKTFEMKQLTWKIHVLI